MFHDEDSHRVAQQAVDTASEPLLRVETMVSDLHWVLIGLWQQEVLFSAGCVPCVPCPGVQGHHPTVAASPDTVPSAYSSPSRRRRLRAARTKKSLWMCAQAVPDIALIGNGALNDNSKTTDKATPKEQVKDSERVDDDELNRTATEMVSTVLANFREEVQGMRSTLAAEELHTETKRDICTGVLADSLSLHETAMELKRFREANGFPDSDLFRRIITQSAVAVGRSRQLVPDQADLREAVKAIQELRDSIKSNWRILRAQESQATDSSEKELASFKLASINKRGMVAAASPKTTRAKDKHKRT